MQMTQAAVEQTVSQLTPASASWCDQNEQQSDFHVREGNQSHPRLTWGVSELVPGL
jgi:hypothetical protein